MFTQDSNRSQVRGQSSMGDEWSNYSQNSGGYGQNSGGYGQNSGGYGQNQSRNDMQQQGFGRAPDREDSGSSKIVCQNYLQNKCMRGDKCLFQHPPSAAASSIGSRLPALTSSKRTQNPWLNFCADFQKGQCPFTDDCRLLHVSQRDEVEFQSSSDLPPGVVEQAMSKSLVMDWAYIGTKPHCKDYLQGSCNVRGCMYRHLNMDQYVVELLAALRTKFMMPRGEMFPNSAQDTAGYGTNNNSQDQFDGRNRFGDAGNAYGGISGFEPDAKRRRGLEFDMDDNRRGNNDSQRQNFPQDNFGQPSRAAPGEDYLEMLKRQNIKATDTNNEVKKTAQNLEEENAELRKALKLALDLNAHARNLQEFRTHLQDIQLSLKKRGFGPETSYPDNWNNRQMDQKIIASSRAAMDLGPPARAPQAMRPSW